MRAVRLLHLPLGFMLLLAFLKIPHPADPATAVQQGRGC
jgi:hypothetical protein